jgi:hypothetical protein
MPTSKQAWPHTDANCLPQLPVRVASLGSPPQGARRSKGPAHPLSPLRATSSTFDQQQFSKREQRAETYNHASGKGNDIQWRLWAKEWHLEGDGMQQCKVRTMMMWWAKYAGIQNWLIDLLCNATVDQGNLRQIND